MDTLGTVAVTLFIAYDGDAGYVPTKMKGRTSETVTYHY